MAKVAVTKKSPKTAKSPKAPAQQLLVLVGATRNEARNIPMVMADLAQARDALRELETELELIVIDDASTDDTVKRLYAEAEMRGLRVQVIDGPGRGLSQAVAAGLRLALQTPDRKSVV